MESVESQVKNYDFNWEVLDVVLRGKSTLDSQFGFQIFSVEAANHFVESYGFDIENPIESAELFGNFQEALNFIRKYFLQPENPQGLKLEIPKKIIELTQVRDLLLMASYAYSGQLKDSAGTYLRNWACSILKVMHTVSHVNQDLRASYFVDIQTQILDRFYKVVIRDQEGRLFLRDSKEGRSTQVELIDFENETKKSRDSTLLKLLHKPENVAEDIFDRVGIRFITKTRLDCLRVIKFLKDHLLIMAPNLKPSRSRNTIIDVEHFKSEQARVFKLLDERKITEPEMISTLEEACRYHEIDSTNPHSSEYYKSIQFTCRQHIKITNPLFAELKELKMITRKSPIASDAQSIIDRVELKNVQKEIKFFYPYEVQIVDELSHHENEKGRSAHSEYKKAQVQTAMKRVMGALVDAVRS